ENIHTGAEFDESAVASLFYLIAHLGVVYYAFCHRAGDLAVEDLSCNLIFHNHGGALAFLACFGMPGYQILARMVFAVLHRSGNRMPSYVNVDGGHKDGDHQSLVFEIFTFVDLFDDNHLPIYGSDDMRIILSSISFGISEELDDQKEEDQ